MSRAVRLWPLLLTGTHHYEKVVSTRNRGQGEFIDAPILAYLGQLGLTAKDIDLVFLGHLHFDHAGGLCDLPGCDVHVQRDELAAARTGLDGGIFADELAGAERWHIQHGEYGVASGVRAVATPGHTAGHMSLLIELPKGRPVLLCGDAADLTENLTDEVAPGYCWQDNEALALASIRKLKSLARSEGAEVVADGRQAIVMGIGLIVLGLFPLALWAKTGKHAAIWASVCVNVGIALMLGASRLAPGAVSSLRHAHTRQDEFVYILQGHATLHTDAGRTPLAPGMCAGFKAGTGNGHRLINETTQDVVYLEIGDRTAGDEGSDPDDDLKALRVDDRWQFVHKDGTPYA